MNNRKVKLHIDTKTKPNFRKTLFILFVMIIIFKI